MGIGLGEITPIKLQLTRDNFNALIGRHGQSVRWLVAEKCTCIDEFQNVDANCEVCDGKGISYNTPTTATHIKTMTAPIDGVIDQRNVIWIKDFTGKEYPITAQDCMAYADVKKGQQYQVKYIEDITKEKTDKAIYVAPGVYRVDLPTATPFGDIQGALLTVSGNFTVTTLYRNYFEIEEIKAPEEEVIVSCSYVDPFNFALVSSVKNEQDRKFLADVQGSVLMIFPQRWNVFEHDLIIALNATLSKKEVIYSTGDIDVLPSFYVAEILSVSTVRNHEKIEFHEGIDFRLYKGNKIKWEADIIEPGEAISVSYNYNPTYKVLGEMPAPRSSENNRFPRKVGLKVYTDLGGRDDI